MMWNRCVVEWLQKLRYDVENYDEVPIFFDDVDEGEFLDEAVFCENLCDQCSSDQGPNLDLKYGQVCRVSVMFSDRVEQLKIAPVIYDNLDLDLSDDVTMWKKQLRYTYCGEEEHFLESEALINDFPDEPKDVDDNVNKPGNFPISEIDHDEEVQVRSKRVNRTLERPQTYTPPIASKKKEDILEIKGPCGLEIEGAEDCIRIKSSEKIRFLNGQLQILDESGNIKRRVNMKKTIKPITKKGLEMTSTDNKVYRIHFNSTKDMKTFIEMSKNVLSPSKNKSAGPWTQLIRLLTKRSSRDLLESKGIIKNEAIFGNTLAALCEPPSRLVPEVITRIVKLIEEPENIKSVGLYRTSGNLAIVQHIRCEVDCGRWDVLEKYRKDVDVLTGTLKLFFRELKEPLIPTDFYERLRPLAITGTSSSPNKTESEVDKEITDIIESLPELNRETLLYIINHLLNVYRYKEENKMDLHNISICWGPSLTTYSSITSNDLVSQTTEFTAVTERLLECYSKVAGTKEVSRVSDETDAIYRVVKKITNLVESHLDVEGIYRKSGSNTKIDAIFRLMNTENNKFLDEIDKFKTKSDIHDLCCALKKYVGSLREPLIPNEFVNHFCEVCDTLGDSMLKEEVRRMVDQLPKKNILLLLMQHLRRVVQQEKSNKMSVVAMTDVWATTLTDSNLPQQNKKNTQKFYKLFQTLITLEDQTIPDLLLESEFFYKKSRESKYDNVDDDDTYDEPAGSGKNYNTKL